MPWLIGQELANYRIVPLLGTGAVLTFVNVMVPFHKVTSEKGEKIGIIGNDSLPL
jgi:hypothetical protein